MSAPVPNYGPQLDGLRALYAEPMRNARSRDLAALNDAINILRALADDLVAGAFDERPMSPRSAARIALARSIAGGSR